jgi:hypothetical protein
VLLSTEIASSVRAIRFLLAHSSSFSFFSNFLFKLVLTSFFLFGIVLSVKRLEFAHVESKPNDDKPVNKTPQFRYSVSDFSDTQNDYSDSTMPNKKNDVSTNLKTKLEKKEKDEE